MGEKGARRNPAGDAAAAALVADLSPLGEISARPMFGGHGVFGDGVMFALVDSTGGCFLRVGPETVAGYDAAGAQAHGRMPYRRIPDRIRRDPDDLLAWARAAQGIARAAKRG
jgi:DNA transformation protein